MVRYVPEEFFQSDHPPVRFMLIPGDDEDSSILFISCMADPEKAVLWKKNDAGIITFEKAVDFGTRGMNNQAKNGFQAPGDVMLPGVTAWTRPLPHPSQHELDSMPIPWDSQTETNEDWCIRLSKEDLLYKTSTRRSTDLVPYLLHDATWPISDCCIYLRRFACRINETKF